MGDIVDSLQPLPISWDPTCLSNQEIDIYLLSPNSDYPRIHLWEGVARTRGTYDAEIMPRWWNATSTQSLQISIVPSGQPLFMSTFPAGPVFNATYTQPSSGMPESADTSKIDSGITAVNDSANAKKAMNPGKKAAAVLLPLLFLLLCAGAYIKLKRSKGLGKRKAWTEAVDKRMSTISTDWKSVSGAGANAAIRNSMAVGNRNSSFSFGALRPSSTFAVEGDESSKQMSQVRTGTGVGLRNPAALSSTERISRVSFAPDTRQSRASIADSRPSGESRRTRAFHSAYIPPVPALPDSATDDTEDTSASFSPRQTQGAMTLTPEDIRSRITAGKTKNGSQDKSEFAEFMPALSSKSTFSVVSPCIFLFTRPTVMRTGSGDPSEPDDFLLSAAAAAPTPPIPAYPKSVTSTPQQLSSPVMSTMPMQPMPANVMSPDEMLRAYAERKKSMSATKGGPVSTAFISYPMPAANSATTPSTNNMRVLYNAATGTISPTNTGNTTYDGGVYDATTSGSAGAYVGVYDATDMSLAPGGPPPPRPTTTTTTDYATSEYSAASAEYSHAVANHQYAFGHHANGSIGVGAYGGAQYAIGEDEDDVSVVGRGYNNQGMGRAA